MIVSLGITELYEPWELSEEIPSAGFPLVADLPEELIERFRAAKTEMQDVWDEVRKYERTQP